MGVNEDQVAVEIVSKKGTAFLVSADEYRSLKETLYLLPPRGAVASSDVLLDVYVSRGPVRHHARRLSPSSSP